MARTVTLGQLRERVRRRADMVNSTFVSDDEINQYVNDAIAELYDLLMQKFGEDYYTIVTGDQTFTANQLTYTLPDNFLKVVGVDIKVQGNNYVTIKPYMFSERNQYNTLLTRGVLAYESTRYRLVGNDIIFTQTPAGQGQYRIWYIPYQPVLELDSDTFNGFNGWEKWVEIAAAMECMMKEESDTRPLQEELARMNLRIERASANRDAGFSYRVTDVRNISNSDDDLFTGARF
jgi:hypothetical protein